MIFNDDLLFIHVPKTGGMAVTQALLEGLPPPVYYTVPKDAPAWRCADPRITLLEGTRHEFLDEASELVSRLGRRIDDFQCVMAAIRNPYEMEVSRYFYLRLGYEWDAGVAQELALTADFTTFAIESPFHGRPSARIDRFLTVDGAPPPNLKVLRFERLEADFRRVLSAVGISQPPKLRKVNATEHRDYRSYLTPEAEEAIYRRFRWVFDRGYYRRAVLDRRVAHDRKARPRTSVDRLTRRRV